MSSDPTLASTNSQPAEAIRRALTRAGASQLVTVGIPADELASWGLEVEVLVLAEPSWVDSLEPCQALLLTAADEELPGSALPAIHDLLSPAGRLLVWGRWDKFKSNGGVEPAGHDALIRQVSEAGFSIIQELLFAPGGLPDAPDRRTSLTVARPENSILRGYRAGDEDAILACFRDCFQFDRSVEYWRWKYRDNPYGGPLISLAFGDGRLLAQYAGYPLLLRLANGRTALTVQMGDTMTAPAARSLGRRSTSLLRRAVRHFFATYSDPEVALYYGYNTGAIHRFSQRFVRGRRHSAVSYWQRDLSPLPKARKRYKVTERQKVDGAFDRFWKRTAARYGVLLQRDSRYLDWRYLKCPDIDYRIFAARRWGRLVGWGVFRRQDHTLVWGDAMFDPRHRDAANEVLRTALDWATVEGGREGEAIDQITAWFPEHPGWWRRTVEGLGFGRQPEPEDLALVYRPHAVADIESQLESLYYTMGDSDLF